MRIRRQVIPTENEVRNRCPLKIVADYKFFSVVGKNNTALTTRYIVSTAFCCLFFLLIFRKYGLGEYGC